MSQLFQLRKKLNITQEELAEKAGISVRTIQRIEAGAELKGYTLNAISDALGVSKEILIDKKIETNKKDNQLLKLINFSSLPFMVIPLANIIIPLIIMFAKKKFTPITKQIVSIQILWTILSSFLIVLSSFVKKWLALNNQTILITITLLLALNLFIIIRNSMEIDRVNNLRIKLNFSII